MSDVARQLKAALGMQADPLLADQPSIYRHLAQGHHTSKVSVPAINTAQPGGGSEACRWLGGTDRTRTVEAEAHRQHAKREASYCPYTNPHPAH